MTAIRRKKSLFHLSYEQRNAVRGYRFILPWLIGFLVFYAGCLVQLGEFSLSKIGLDAATGMTKEYVGLSNYVEAFTSHATFKQGSCNLRVPLSHHDAENHVRSIGHGVEVVVAQIM